MSIRSTSSVEEGRRRGKEKVVCLTPSRKREERKERG